MAVRVRLFAALREAAGTGEELVPAGPLPQVLDGLRERHGTRFTAVLGVSSVLVDGTPVARAAVVDLADGAELALLPPVSGGSRGADDGPVRPAPVRDDLPEEWIATADIGLGERSGRGGRGGGGRGVAGDRGVPGRPDSGIRAPAGVRGAGGVRPRVAGVALAAGVLGVAAGGPVWAAVVLAGSAGVLAELVVLFDRAATRPVVPVVAAAGLGVPALVAAGVRDTGVLTGAAVALAVAGAFGRLAVARQHGGVTAALGSTLVATMPVALGAAALLLLRDRPAGAVLALLTLLLPAAAALGITLAGARDLAPDARHAAGAATAAVAAALALLLPGAPGATTTALVWLAAVAATLLGAALTAHLRAVAGLSGLPALRVVGDGAAVAVAAAPLLTAPLALLLAP